ncbi:MAG TPA: sensor histidine kinase [Bryobacteraceae bacterium]|nr:sensor histidine kinase [Bryobacteraceae bacterium]
MPQNTSAETLTVQVRRFGRLIESSKLARLGEEFSRALRKAGFDNKQAGALRRASPLAAVEFALARKPLKHFWRDVAGAGRDLAKMNITPAQVKTALDLGDSILDKVPGSADFSEARTQLRFSTILAMNQAYYDVREEEHQIFYRMLQIEVDAANTDVLLRGLLEAVADAVGADAAHAYLTSADSGFWEVRASTARAASPETLLLVEVPAGVRKGLGKACRAAKPAQILDAGWRKRYDVVWSAPMGDEGVLQFAFASGRELLPRELELLAAAAERCYAASRKTRLLEDIAEREKNLRKLAIRMLMVEENERRRISRELHDDAGQSLVVIRLQMEMIELLLPENSEERERLATARDITEKTILDTRRLISDLSPAVLDQLGLGAALRQLVNRFRKRYACEVVVAVGQLPQLDSNFELVIYRLAQECLNNIAQHSSATSVNISVSVADRVLRLHVEDNGKGFNVEHALERSDSFGLIGIRERVAVLGGSVDIISTRKEGQSTRRSKKSGTIVRIELPIP